jgi:hypothetical protein
MCHLQFGLLADGKGSKMAIFRSSTMNESMATPSEDSAIDDVRRIREQFSSESGGDIRRHVEQTQAAFQELQAQLRLPIVAPPASASPRR